MTIFQVPKLKLLCGFLSLCFLAICLAPLSAHAASCYAPNQVAPEPAGTNRWYSVCTQRCQNGLTAAQNSLQGQTGDPSQPGSYDGISQQYQQALNNFDSCNANCSRRFPTAYNGGACCPPYSQTDDNVAYCSGALNPDFGSPYAVGQFQNYWAQKGTCATLYSGQADASNAHGRADAERYLATNYTPCLRQCDDGFASSIQGTDPAPQLAVWDQCRQACKATLSQSGTTAFPTCVGLPL